jgi:hypothetical protein
MFIKGTTSTGNNCIPHKISEEDKWTLAEQGDYIVVYPSFKQVGRYDCYLIKPSDPFTLSDRNFYRPAEPRDLPEELKCYHAYGNAELSDAEIVFMADSNHANPILTARRIQKTVDHVLKTDDVFLQEGFAFNVVFKAKKQNGEKFIYRGWESNDHDPLKAIAENDVQYIHQTRDNFLLHHIARVSPKRNGKIVVYIGEGHLSEQFCSRLDGKKYICLYDRELIADYESNRKVQAAHYYSEATKKKSILFNFRDNQVEFLKAKIKGIGHTFSVIRTPLAGQKED